MNLILHSCPQKRRFSGNEKVSNAKQILRGNDLLGTIKISIVSTS